ncbi:hypothetical protein ACGFNU_01030 [Spirillospora sp. NPDC048911]|uniref:hypothetical protein n=1 Tax=Spirillospora sp. NPDC048911 TaxID=3364527 RepID=UPI00371F854C
MRPVTYVGLILAAAVFSGIGFWRDGWAFASNLFAEATGIFIGIAIGFALVDRLIESEARRRWARVSDFTLTSIRHYLEDIEFACITTPALMKLEAANLRSETGRTLGQAFAIFSRHLAENAEEISTEYQNQEVRIDPRLGDASMSHPDPDGGTRYVVGTREAAQKLRREWMNEVSTGDFYREVRPAFERLREIITPRVLEFGHEPQLVGALVAVEAADRAWFTALKTIEDDWGMPEHYAWEQAASALEACAHLADLVDGLQGSSSPHA